MILVHVQMYKIFRLLIGVPDYSSSELSNVRREAGKEDRRERTRKQPTKDIVAIDKKIEIWSDRGLYKYINRQAVDVQNEREENTKHTHRDNKTKY